MTLDKIDPIILGLLIGAIFSTPIAIVVVSDKIDKIREDINQIKNKINRPGEPG